jgi:2-polyprenyl-6-methoxyphenol hydroxylase-like FAD-dependent oxidoreductase
VAGPGVGEGRRMIDVPVLVVGGGPVGLTTTYALQNRGIRVLVVERNPTTTRHPKMDVTNGRSMEHFRRLGIADRIRDVAVPRDHCMDVAWVTRLSEWELARFEYADVHAWRENIRARNDGSQPLEPNMRLSQVVLEPALREILETCPLVDLRFGWAFESLTQDADGVTATIRHTATGATETVRSALLAGCDGGASKVRDSLDFSCTGKWNVLPFYMVHFRTPSKELMQRHGRAWHYQSPVGGTLIAQDDEEIYTLHNLIPPGVDPNSVEPKQFLFESLGVDFPCEVIQANPWCPHLVVADHFGSGRVWLAGDSTHQFIPTGGYGMNTGIGDAVDVAWKFAAILQGWGGPKLLPSIESERRPVAVTNCDAAGKNMAVRLKIAEAYSPVIHADTAEGAAARATLGGLIQQLGNLENEAFGIELGSRYRHSPIVCTEPDEPDWRIEDYIPSTWPGVRAPHVFLSTGEAIFDLLGPDFTLVAFSDIDATAFVAAAAERGVPLSVIRICDPHVRQIYERDLVLVRPDHHVAWRGQRPPSDPLAVIDQIRGA